MGQDSAGSIVMWRGGMDVNDEERFDLVICELPFSAFHMLARCSRPSILMMPENRGSTWIGGFHRQ